MEQQKFKVTFIPVLGANIEFEKRCDTYQQAVLIKDAIADYTLLLHNSGLMVDHSNMAVIEQFIDGEWEEVDELDIEETPEHQDFSADRSEAIQILRDNLRHPDRGVAYGGINDNNKTRAALELLLS